MKTNGKAQFFFLTIVIIIIFSSCFSEWSEDTGSLIINLGGNDGRSAMPSWPPEDILLDYKITLSGRWKTITITAESGETIKTAVYAGRWNVYIEAFFEGDLYAKSSGEDFVDVRAGQTNHVSIQMLRAFLNTYTVTFDANGGSPALTTQTVTEGGKAIQPDKPTMTGLYFVYWYIEDPDIEYDFNTPVTFDITLYAKWSDIFHTVTFNSNGGSEVESKQVGEGGKVDRPTDPIKDGFYFAYWFNEETDAEWDFETDTVTRDITLSAKWNINQHTVTFDVNGGSPTPPVQTIDHGGKVTEPQGITKSDGESDYRFAGWYTDNDTLWDFETPVTQDITLYAKWEVVPPGFFVVTFNSNEGSIVADHTVENGGKIEPPPPAPTKTGHTFAGWFTDNNTFLIPWNFATDTVDQPVTLYAKWTINQYTVTFNTNGGTPAPLVQTIDHGSNANKPADPTKEGYSFAYWFIEEDETKTEWDFNTPIIVDINLKAKWIFIVTFNSNEGTSTQAQQIDDDGNSKATEPQDVTRGGYKLLGWFTDNTTFLNKWNFDTPITVNITLYANWELINTFNVPSDVDWNYAVTTISYGATTSYTINVTGDFSIDGIPSNAYTFGNATGITVNLIVPGTENRTISLSSNGSLLRTRTNQTVIMTTRLKLQGHAANNASLVYISGGTFTMNGGEISGNTYSGVGGGVYLNSGTFNMSGSAKVSGNTINATGSGGSGTGGGVYVSNGTFNMSGGEISGNTANSGGGGGSGSGAGVYSRGTFNMSGGEISDNFASGSGANGGGVYQQSGTLNISDSAKVSGNRAIGTGAGGGGVYVSGCTFTMSGGEISDNTTNSGSNAGGGYGGGVYQQGGTFTMSGSAKVSGNTAGREGGGVYVSQSTFNMSGSAKVSGNTATDGGGVYVSQSTFTMSGGEISGNTATSTSNAGGGGGGVYFSGSSSNSFNMISGKISGNTAGGSGSSSIGGGGVYARGTFRIVTGTIYGSGETGTDNGKPLANSLTGSATNGAALYVPSGDTAQRGTFSTPGDITSEWTPAGTLSTTNSTITVLNGNL
jgi:uncharacterized repeat protein (TIGR02543 family)